MRCCRFFLTHIQSYVFNTKHLQRWIFRIIFHLNSSKRFFSGQNFGEMNTNAFEFESSAHKNSDEVKKENSTAVKEVILTVNSSPLILNIPPSLCSPSAHITQQRLSCSGSVCRICHEDGLHEDLISPCLCAGSLGLAHATCIEKWLSASNTTSCEICKYHYNLLRRPKSLLQWLQTRSPLNGPSGFCGDVFCLVLLTPLCIGSVYLCAIGARAYIRHGLWEGTGLAMLCCFLMAVYILWCFVAVRFHWKRFRRWQATNKTVHLLDKFCPGKVENSEKHAEVSEAFVIS